MSSESGSARYKACAQRRRWDLSWGWHMGTTLLGGAFRPVTPAKMPLCFISAEHQRPCHSENTSKLYGESPVSTAMGVTSTKGVYRNPELRKKYTKDGFG